jgi:hypothetical protein
VQFPRPVFPRNPDGRGKFNERIWIPADNCPRKIPSVPPPSLEGVDGKDGNGKLKEGNRRRTWYKTEIRMIAERE